MADAKKLKQDLTAIEQATRQLAEELDKAYRDYLAALIQSLRRQVISACYSLCTKGYPNQFLKLTSGQRQQTQQQIQGAIAQSCAQLVDPDLLLKAARQQRLKALQLSEDVAAEVPQGAPRPVILQPRESIQSGLDLNLTIRAAGVSDTETPESQTPDAQTSETEQSVEQPPAESQPAEDQKTLDPGQSQDVEAQTSEPRDVDPPDTESQELESRSAEPQGVELAGDSGQAAGPPAAPFPEAAERQEARTPEAETQAAETQAAEPQEIELQKIEPQEIEPQETESQETEAIAAIDEPLESAKLPTAPSALVSRQEQLETGVTLVIDQLADDINDHLREVGIVPKDLPEAVLEAVIKSGAAEVIEGPPNVLSLLVQGDEDDDEVSPVMAIRLQVSEIEFNDTHLSARRSQLRDLYGQARKLNRKYEKYQREWTTVEAESAWRATWYEPS